MIRSRELLGNDENLSSLPRSGDRGIQEAHQYRLSPQKGGQYRPCILSLRLLLKAGGNYRKLEAGPQNPSSTLVEEPIKVSNNWDLMEEANEDKRLIKRKYSFCCSDSPTTLTGPWTAKKAGQITQNLPGPKPIYLWGPRGVEGGMSWSALLWLGHQEGQLQPAPVPCESPRWEIPTHRLMGLHAFPAPDPTQSIPHYSSGALDHLWCGR